MNRSRGLFFLLLALGASCRHRIPPPSASLPSPEALLTRTAAVEGRVQSVKGQAKLTVHSPRANGTVTLVISAARPALLHLEVLDFFGRPLASLVSDGVRFGVYQVQEGVYYQGPASAANVSQFLPIELPPSDLVGLLLGQAPRPPAPDEQLRFDEGEGNYVLLRRGAGTQQTLTLDPATARVLRSQSATAHEETDLRFDEFDGSARGFFPKRLRLKAAGLSTSMELRYQGVALNGTFEPGTFVPEAPEHVRVVSVDGEGHPVGPGP